MKEELILKLQELLKEDASEDNITRATEIKNDYLKACETVTQDQLKKFIEDGGNNDDYKPIEDPLDARFNELVLSFEERNHQPTKVITSETTDQIQETEIKEEVVPGVAVEEVKVEEMEEIKEVEMQVKVDQKAAPKQKEGKKEKEGKEELILKLEELLKDDASEDTITRANEIKNDYLKACETVTQDQLKKFLEEGGNSDDYEPKKDPLDSRFNELLVIFADRDHKQRKVLQSETAGKLKAKEEIVAAIEKLITEESNIGKAFHAFKDLQTKWNEIGNVSSKEYRNLQSIYHRHSHNFYYNMKLSKELRELDFKRNLEQRTQLLTKIESLLPMESIRGIERMITLYRMEWSELGPTPPETIEPLRTKYRELIGQVFQKIRADYQERQKDEVSNLDAKKKLLERAQGIANENFENGKQWQTMTETLNGILEEWKKIGFGPRQENEKVWEDLRAAMNTFYNKKRDYFGGIKKVQKEGRDKKLAVIEKAEKIAAATHESFEDATKEILNLQNEWKTAGHIEQWEENKLWKRFREACDKFFVAKREKFSERDNEQLKNLELKTELVKKVEAFTPSGKTEEDLNTLRSFSDEWKTISHVPFKEKQKIWEKFKTALDAKYDSLKLESSQKHLLKFKNSVDSLSNSEDSGTMLRKEQGHIKEKITKLQQTINQYENNLGFFRNSKNMGGLLTEVENNLSNAKEEMEMLKKKLKMFNEVPVK